MTLRVFYFMYASLQIFFIWYILKDLYHEHRLHSFWGFASFAVFGINLATLLHVIFHYNNLSLFFPAIMAEMRVPLNIIVIAYWGWVFCVHVPLARKNYQRYIRLQELQRQGTQDVRKS